eukprot:1153212-Pelagomonas_calceolata.AAC.2
MYITKRVLQLKPRRPLCMAIQLLKLWLKLRLEATGEECQVMAQAMAFKMFCLKLEEGTARH